MCDEKNQSLAFLSMFFYMKNQGREVKEMFQTEKYYVVKRTKEKDELYSTIDAASVEEVHAIFRIRYEREINQMEEGDAYYIFSEIGKLEFDENNRIVIPDVDMTGIQR